MGLCDSLPLGGGSAVCWAGQFMPKLYTLGNIVQHETTMKRARRTVNSNCDAVESGSGVACDFTKRGRRVLVEVSERGWRSSIRHGTDLTCA